MSYNNFMKAIDLATKCKYYTITEGGIDDKSIEQSEKILDVRFSKQLLQFYKELGYLSFYGVEIFTIEPYSESNIIEGNSVAYALHEREKYKLPNNLIPIYNYDDGNLAFLDYNKLNSHGEPSVVLWFFNGVEYEESKLLNDDFGDFLLELVEAQLAEQLFFHNRT